ncbi:MAG TPA: ATP-dependent DNA ligase, partial [Microlunatus sp.]|nr:ATP-dependent DNA ligase [Microlunatus sp.]
MPDEERSGISFSHLDQELFDGAGATKRDLVDYLEAIAERMLPVLADRPLSVIRVRPGQPAFMQKNLPKYTPEWVSRAVIWAEASRREVSYP